MIQSRRRPASVIGEGFGPNTSPDAGVQQPQGNAAAQDAMGESGPTEEQMSLLDGLENVADGQADVCFDQMESVDESIVIDGGGGGGLVCDVVGQSRPLNQALAEELRGLGMPQADIDVIWGEVQRASAAAYGDFYDASGTIQRSCDSFLSTAEQMDAIPLVGPTAADGVRAAMVGALNSAIPALESSVLDGITNGTVGAVESAGVDVPCLDLEVRTWIAGLIPEGTFGEINVAGSSQEIRRGITQQFANYRTAVQAAVQGLAGTLFQPWISGGEDGLSMEMLTQEDFDARAVAADASGNTSVDAGHFHASAGAGSGVEDVQTMLSGIYGMQTTSNTGASLMNDAVAGTDSNFDMNLIAISGDSEVGHDSFLNNTVDVADITAEPEVAPVGGVANGPQSQESVYAHFISERLHDQQTNTADTSALQARWAAIEVRRTALQARSAALTATQQGIIASMNGAGPMPAGATSADQSTVTSFINDVNTFNTDEQTLITDQATRFDPSHDHAIDVENDYNRERGFNTRPH